MAAIGTADATRIDAARAFVARVHGEQATVVNRHGNGFCWGWAVNDKYRSISAIPDHWQRVGCDWDVFFKRYDGRHVSRA